MLMTRHDNEDEVEMDLEAFLNGMMDAEDRDGEWYEFLPRIGKEATYGDRAWECALTQEVVLLYAAQPGLPRRAHTFRNRRVF